MILGRAGGQLDHAVAYHLLLFFLPLLGQCAFASTGRSDVVGSWKEVGEAGGSWERAVIPR